MEGEREREINITVVCTFYHKFIVVTMIELPDSAFVL